jgi:hypothetical protein
LNALTQRPQYQFFTSGNASFSDGLLDIDIDIAIAQVESIIEPIYVADAIEWQPVDIVGAHCEIPVISDFNAGTC